VFPRYAGLDETVAPPPAVDVAAAAVELGGHVRTDWLADDRLHQRHLPFEHRDAGVFAADGARLTRRLAELGGGGWRYVHRGDPGPLLDVLTGAGR
jgi:hypothetical protein